MLTPRWSALIRHGLLGTSLVGLTASPASAEPCDDVAERTVALVLGLDVAPKTRVIAGVEARQCLTDRTEALLRFEIGGGSPRVIAGLRARPFERELEDAGELEHVGVEAGGILGFDGNLAAHLAGTYGTHSAYLSIQSRIPVTGPERPTAFSLLGGFAPWTAFGATVVEGRPITHAGQLLRPELAHLPRARTAEERAVRDHFVSSAQLELSSVWTFLRLAAELAAVGAPVELIERALDAADDEVRHAELCARLSGGARFHPLAMELARPRFAARSPAALATLAVEAWLEGCLNETAAAEEARLAASEACGPARAPLAAIAQDEAGHAELSWAVLAWVLATAPDVATSALASLPPPAAAAPTERRASDPALVRHGVPSTAIRAAARAHAEATARARLVALAA